MSNLPKQVQRQAEEVAELDKMFEEPPQEQPDEAAAKADQVPAEVPPPAPPAPVKSDEETWQRRYSTLQGMFNAEVPRLNAQVKELQQQLQAVLAQQQSAPKQVEQPASKKLVTEQDVEAYGGELIDLMRRQASEVFQAERTQFQQDLAALQAENAELRKQLTGVAEKQGVTDRRAYFVELSKLVPDYETINVDQAFMDWLAEVDPVSGLTRQTFLNSAFEHVDPVRTASVFNAWKQVAGKVQQPKQQAAQELQRQVAPGTSRASTPTTQPTGAEKIWSMAEIERFYVDVSKGKYARDEATRIEAEIDAAVAAGRLR